RQDLRAVADRRHRLVRLEEVPHDLDHPLLQPDVLRRAAARDHERVVILRLHIRERGVDPEVVAALLAVRLITFEVVDRRPHGLAGLLARTHRVHRVTHGLERLERDHDFVVFDEIADQHEDPLGHGASPPRRLGGLQWWFAGVAPGRVRPPTLAGGARPTPRVATFGHHIAPRRARQPAIVDRKWKTIPASVTDGILHARLADARPSR